nr:MAG TPA: hypothetical protein [Caudoviricetes sp.]
MVSPPIWCEPHRQIYSEIKRVIHFNFVYLPC